MQHGHKFLGTSMLAGVLIALMLSGCVERTGGARTVGSTIERQARFDCPGSDLRSADGTPLTNIAGYNLYYGLTSRTYDFIKHLGNETTYAISGLEQGRTYYFTVTAYDAAGRKVATPMR